MWLVHQDLWPKILAWESGEIRPDANLIEKIEAISGDIPVSISNGEGSIDIVGPLTKKPSPMAAFFGIKQTTYQGIINAIAQAESDSSVEQIVLNIDSGGGQVDGLFDTLDAIKNTSKPVEARISGMAASAAYAIASVSDKIVSNSIGDMIGSIGVVYSTYVSKSFVDITNTDSPDKRPDASTEEGKQVIREQLDETFGIFAKYISEGRGISENEVKENYGKGRVFMSQNALSRGMIDEITTNATSIGVKQPVAAAAQQQEVRAMTLDELRGSHPDVYAAAVAVGAGQANEASAKKMDEMTAHLTFGKNCGCLESSVNAVLEGKELTETMKAEYMTAKANKEDIEARQSDSEEVGVQPEAQATAEKEEDYFLASLKEA